MKVIQPRPTWVRRSVPEEQRVRVPFPVWHVLSRYPHHAGASGYDRLCDFVGEQIRVGPALYFAGETLLRPWALLDSKLGGQLEYSRYDWVLEQAAMKSMREERGALFHFLYGEKNFRHAWRLTGRRGNRLIASLHHTEPQYPGLFRSTRQFSYLSHAIVMTQSLKEFAERLVGPGRVTVVPYGVDVECFRPLDSQCPKRHPVLTFAGFHLRDYDTLARVVRIVLSRHKTANFVLMSKDDRCRGIAQQYPNRVTRLERLPDDEYRSVLQSSDLMVLPLTSSAAVTSVLEAMACGVPVLTTEGGVRDYIEDEGGALFSPGDADAMAEAALSLLSDDESLLSMKRRARRQALKFSWPTIAQRTAKVYSAVMSS